MQYHCDQLGFPLLQMTADLKTQWNALFPFANEVGEFVAVLRDIYAMMDKVFGQTEGGRAMYVSMMASVVTISALLHPRVEARFRRSLEVIAHLSLQVVMLVLVGGPWLVFPLLNQCVVRGHFRILSVVLVSTAFVAGWGTHCDPEGKTLTTAVIAWVGWVQVDTQAYWRGIMTFSMMVFAIGGTFM
jgi:hypothetical protein